MPPKQNNNKPSNNKPQTTTDNRPKQSQPTQEPGQGKAPKKQPEPQDQGKPAQTQAEVPPVVAAIRSKNDISFIALPIDPDQLPKTPQRLPISVKNPTSDIVFSPAGDRCAIATSEGIMVYNTPTAPGSTFSLQLHAQLPYTTARYIQFSPLGNYLISFETYQRTCRVNLRVWDLSTWKDNVCSATVKEAENGDGEDKDAPSTPESTPTSPAEDQIPVHPSIIYQMPQRSDLPTDIHASIQWTDDEKYCFILRDVGTLMCFLSTDMTKPHTSLSQKRLSAFQLSKLPKGNDKAPLPEQQHISLFSPSVGNEPAKCMLFRTLDLIRGQSVKSGSHPPANPPKVVGNGDIVWGPLKPVQQLAIFRSSKAKMEWHNNASALLLHAYFEDEGDSSYYDQTRLFVMYTTKEAVAVSFGTDKPDIHDAAWCPTGFEFATLHGIPRSSQITVWHAKDCAAASILGEGPFNNIRYHPSGRLLLVVGMGSLNGKMEIWDKSKLLKLYQGQDMDSPRTFFWTPCGRYFLSASIWPFLRVDNQFKIHRFDGALLYQEKGCDSEKKAVSAGTPAQAGPGSTSTISAMHQGPSESHILQFVPNFYPRAGQFNDVKISPELLQKAQKMMSAPPPPAESTKYIPPHLREQMQSQPQQTAPIPQQNGPRNLAQERKQGNLSVDQMFGATSASKFSEQQKEQQLQKQQQQQQKTNSKTDDAFGSWRR